MSSVPVTITAGPPVPADPAALLLEAAEAAKCAACGCAHEASAALAALADPVRLRIVGVLAGGGRCVCDLQEKVPVAANLLSYHLRVLRDAGLVAAARRGRWIDYRLDGDGFAALWTQASAAGVPLPGDHVSAAWRGPSCDEEER